MKTREATSPRRTLDAQQLQRRSLDNATKFIPTWSDRGFALALGLAHDRGGKSIRRHGSGGEGSEDPISPMRKGAAASSSAAANP